LRTPQGPRYRVRKHPGFKGKQPFKKGLEAKKDDAARVATALVQSRVVDVWRMGRETTITVRGDKRTFGQGLVG
jgi:thioredoxin reductase